MKFGQKVFHLRYFICQHDECTQNETIEIQVLFTYSKENKKISLVIVSHRHVKFNKNENRMKIAVMKVFHLILSL